MDKIYNFSAGPAILPEPVFDSAARAVKNFAGTGLSVLEVSHRSREIVAVMDEAVSLVRELLQVPESHKILFLQGGASLQFCMVPYNLLSNSGTAGYVETGVWAKKAVKEACCFGEVDVLASSAEQNFSFIPKSYEISKTLTYLHLTSNNTIYGTQYKMFPQTTVPLVSDMSSDIFSRPVDVSRFGVIYAGAQKNLGPAGITLAIVREDLLGKIDRTIPTMLDYRTHIDKASMFNTPPVFALFVVNETLRWLKASGGVTEMEAKNRVKADKLYAAIDGSSLFRGTAAMEDRSMMNVPFVMSNPELESEFLAMATDSGLSGLKGHRSVGGFRASIYNAMPEAGIDALIACMAKFEKAKG